MSQNQVTIREIFFVTSLCAILFYFMMAIFSESSTFLRSLYFDPNDVFMDFFNSIYDSMGQYKDTKVIYPPFINLCFRVIGYIVVPSASNAFLARTTIVGGMAFAIFVMIVVFWIYHSVNSEYKYKHKDLLTIIIILSLPFLFCIERGNVIIIAALLILPFVRWYDSENKRKRYFAHLCLALSVNIKIYPIVFCLLILKNKQYREFLHFIFICAAILLISLLLLQDSFVDFVINIFSTSGSNGSGGTGLANPVYVILSIFNVPQIVIKTISYTIMAIVILASIYLVLKDEKMERWKVVMLLSLILCTCGTFNSYYCLVYMFVPLIMFLNSNPKSNRENLIYVVLFILMTIPLIGFKFEFLGEMTTLRELINGFVPTIAILYLIISEYMKMKNQTSIYG